MKKLIVLFVSVLTVGMFSSCSSDDDAGSAPLEGRWAYSENGIAGGGQEVLLDYDHNEISCGKDYIEILANGTINDAYYFLDGDDECDTDVDAGTWTRNGNTVVVNYGDGAVTATILTLTNSTLKLQYTEGDINFIEVFTRE